MIKFRRAAWAAAGMAVVLAVTAGCGSDGGDAEGDGGSAKVRVAWQKNALIGLMDLVADEQGFFKNRGLDVTLMPMETGQVAVTSALRGELDIFYGPQSNVVQAASQGECFKVLSTGHGNSINIVARKGLALPSKTSDAFPGGLADLKGLKIGVPNLGSATDRNTRKVLAAAGVQDSDVTYVAVGVGATAVAALDKGAVDAMAAFPPASEVLPEGSYQMVVDLVNNPDTSPLNDVIISHQITTCDYLKNNEKTVLDYCRAYLDARDWAVNPANADAVSAILAKNLQLDAAVAKTMWQKYGAVWKTPTALTSQMWEAQTKYNSPQEQTTPPFGEWIFGPCASEDPRA